MRALAQSPDPLIALLTRRPIEATEEAILNALCAERLPLAVLRSDAAGYLQAEITTTAARDGAVR